MTTLLEVRDLRVGYGELPVLQGIDFDIEAGSRTVLLGLNGAGKTTTVASIAGLLKPWGGSITFDGERIDGRDPAVLVDRGVSLVPEGRRVFPALTVAEKAVFIKDAFSWGALARGPPTHDRRSRSDATFGWAGAARAVGVG